MNNTNSGIREPDLINKLKITAINVNSIISNQKRYNLTKYLEKKNKTSQF